jgi:hypothetical protein
MGVALLKLIVAVCLNIEVAVTDQVSIVVRGGDGDPDWLSEEFIIQAMDGPNSLVHDEYIPTIGRLFEVSDGPHAGKILAVWADNGDPTSFKKWPKGTAMRLQLYEVLDRDEMSLRPIGLGWATR